MTKMLIKDIIDPCNNQKIFEQILVRGLYIKVVDGYLYFRPNYI